MAKTPFEALRELVLKVAGSLSWLPPTLARLTLGWVFVESGWGKIHNIQNVIGFFRDLGIPAPELQAPLAAWTELVCGALLLLGLVSRIASIPLMITMVVAILTAKKGDLHGASDLFGFIEWLYMVLLAWVGTAGPGPLSLDAILDRPYRARAAAAASPRDGVAAAPTPAKG